MIKGKNSNNMQWWRKTTKKTIEIDEKTFNEV